jgi:predicted nucleic acid-binding protein
VVISTQERDAHQLAWREQQSRFDALIAETASRHRCDVLFAGDFSHGCVIAGMQVPAPLLD